MPTSEAPTKLTENSTKGSGDKVQAHQTVAFPGAPAHLMGAMRHAWHKGVEAMANLKDRKGHRRNNYWHRQSARWTKRFSAAMVRLNPYLVILSDDLATPGSEVLTSDSVAVQVDAVV